MTQPINENECYAAEEGQQDPRASQLAPLFGADEDRRDDEDEPRP